MTVHEKKFDRFLTITAGFLCLLALVFTVIALRTSSWTINEYSPDGEIEWHGLFSTCTRLKCRYYYNFPVMYLTIIAAVLLLFSMICIFLMGVHSFPRKHFYLTPLITFIAVLLLFIALVLYARKSVTNGVSSRLVITSIVMGFTSFAIVTFVAGRYSVFYQRNPMDFQYNQAAVRKAEVEQ